jgi:hypothetical protein
MSGATNSKDDTSPFRTLSSRADAEGGEREPAPPSDGRILSIWRSEGSPKAAPRASHIERMWSDGRRTEGLGCNTYYEWMSYLYCRLLPTADNLLTPTS